jgi:peroxiredoxin
VSPRPVRLRWVIAGAGALLLALLTMDLPLPSPGALFGAAGRATPFTCPPDAKPANLDFTLDDAAEQPVALSDYKGDVILLDFWATWCEPCKEEIPGFEVLQSRYGASGLQVVGVSVDDTPQLIKPFAAQYRMNYLVLQGRGHDDLMDTYGPIWGIPVSVVISRDGRVCATHAGVTDMATFAREIKALL